MTVKSDILKVPPYVIISNAAGVGDIVFSLLSSMCLPPPQSKDHISEFCPVYICFIANLNPGHFDNTDSDFYFIGL
jgi:hypothetical protein